MNIVCPKCFGKKVKKIRKTGKHTTLYKCLTYNACGTFEVDKRMYIQPVKPNPLNELIEGLKSSEKGFRMESDGYSESYFKKVSK